MRWPVLNEQAAVPSHKWLHLSLLAIPAQGSAVSQARDYVGAVLRDWGLPEMTDTIQLIVSELATNAVRASTELPPRPASDGQPARVLIRLSSDLALTLVEVWDSSSRPPTPGQPTSDDESGRGLMLVAALSQQSGWTRLRRGTGKIVWALVAH